MVDDLDMNRDLVKLILQTDGPRLTRSANDGFEAITMAKLHIRFDLILMDIQMPGLDGSEAMQRNTQAWWRECPDPDHCLTANVMADQVDRYKTAEFTTFWNQSMSIISSRACPSVFAQPKTACVTLIVGALRCGTK